MSEEFTEEQTVLETEDTFEMVQPSGAKSFICMYDNADVGDYASAKRFLVVMFYLNDVEEGGQTIFPEYQLAAKPTKGSLMVFPPFWTHPHLAEAPKSNDKYIISTYLHYL